MLEERAVGGVCLNEGCIPTKSLLYSAKIFDYAQRKDIGVSCEQMVFDQTKVIQRKDRTVRTLVGGVQSLLKMSKVTVVKERAKITGRDVAGYMVEAGGETYLTEKMIIATGSSPIIPKIDQLADTMKKGNILTNREILHLTDIPKELVIIGGGVIGLEMADYYCAVGSKVTVIEMLGKVAGTLDAELSTLL